MLSDFCPTIASILSLRWDNHHSSGRFCSNRGLISFISLGHPPLFRQILSHRLLHFFHFVGTTTTFPAVFVPTDTCFLSIRWDKTKSNKKTSGTSFRRPLASITLVALMLQSFNYCCATSFMEKLILPILSLPRQTTVTLSPSVSTSSTWLILSFAILEI